MRRRPDGGVMQPRFLRRFPSRRRFGTQAPWQRGEAWRTSGNPPCSERRRRKSSPQLAARCPRPLPWSNPALKLPHPQFRPRRHPSMPLSHRRPCRRPRRALTPSRSGFCRPTWTRSPRRYRTSAWLASPSPWCGKCAAGSRGPALASAALKGGDRAVSGPAEATRSAAPCASSPTRSAGRRASSSWPYPSSQALTASRMNMASVGLGCGLPARWPQMLGIGRSSALLR